METPIQLGPLWGGSSPTSGSTGTGEDGAAAGRTKRLQDGTTVDRWHDCIRLWRRGEDDTAVGRRCDCVRLRRREEDDTAAGRRREDDGATALGVMGARRNCGGAGRLLGSSRF